MARTLTTLSATDRAGIKLGQVIFAAPDVDVEEFEKAARLIIPMAKGISLYISANDLAIRASRLLHRDSPRAGDVSHEDPLIITGIDTLDISSVDTAALGTTHAAYAESRELVNDIGLLMRKGERPPDIRNINYKLHTNRKGIYWRYGN
jgi:esterase/lipase superfamily enzyme